MPHSDIRIERYQSDAGGMILLTLPTEMLKEQMSMFVLD